MFNWFHAWLIVFAGGYIPDEGGVGASFLMGGTWHHQIEFSACQSEITRLYHSEYTIVWCRPKIAVKLCWRSFLFRAHQCPLKGQLLLSKAVLLFWCSSSLASSWPLTIWVLVIVLLQLFHIPKFLVRWNECQYWTTRTPLRMSPKSKDALLKNYFNFTL